LELLRRPIFTQGVARALANAIEKDYAAQQLPVLDQRLAMALWKVRPQPLYLLTSHPEKEDHRHPCQFSI
jgi:hypothetical protein